MTTLALEKSPNEYSNGLLSVPKETDLLFAWLSPFENRTHSQQKSPHSPLMKAKLALRRTLSGGRQDREQREREKEARDACVWLKATGFPQYVQMYEEGQFPINLTVSQVERDHSFLDQAAISALFRRLNVLNKCADLMTEKINKDDESDEEEQRALSDNWKYQKRSGRWSRKLLPRDNKLTSAQYSPELPAQLVVAELRRSLGDLRENSLVRSYEFTAEFIDENSSNSPHSPSPPVARPRSLSVGVDEGKKILPRQRTSSVTANTDAPKSPMIERVKKSSHGESGRELWSTPEGSPVHIRTSSNPISLSYDSPRLNAAPRKVSYAINQAPSPLVRMSNHSSSTNAVAEDKDRSLRSPSPVLVQGRFFSRMGSASVDSILEDMTSDIRVRVSKLKDKSYSQSLENGGIFDHRFSSEGCSSSLDLSDSLFDDSENQDDSSPGRAGFNDLSSTVESLKDLGLDSEISPKRNSKLKRSRKYTDQDGGKGSRGQWHSFKRTNSFLQSIKPARTQIPVDELSVGQLSVIRKLCLLRLTALLELYNPNNKIGPSLGKLLNQKKKMVKSADGVFGVPLILNVQKHGHPLPPVILKAMDYIREKGLKTEGLFRKAGNAARVLLLEELLDKSPEFDNFEKYGINDIAAMIKSFLRRLPEPLINSKVCDALIHIHDYVPPEMRMQAIQSLVALLPCQTRLALQELLLFMRDIVDNAVENQMDADNLSVCMTQSIAVLPSGSKAVPGMRRTGSFRKHHEVKLTQQEFAQKKEIMESLAANKCLAYMIEEVDQLFMVSSDMLQACKFSYLEVGEPVPYTELGQDKYGFGDYRSYVEGCVAVLLKEQRQKFRNWNSFDSINGVDISWQKVGDGLPLRLCRSSVEIPAPTHQVFRRIWNEQHLWDPGLEQVRVLSEPDMHTQIYQYSATASTTQSSREYCVLRSWRYIENGGFFMILCTSVTHPAAAPLATIQGTALASRYLIEPLEAGLTKLTYIGRFDPKGVSAEYYNYGLGPFLCTHVANIKKSFKKGVSPDFQETSV